MYCQTESFLACVAEIILIMLIVNVHTRGFTEMGEWMKHKMYLTKANSIISPHWQTILLPIKNTIRQTTEVAHSAKITLGLQCI